MELGKSKGKVIIIGVDGATFDLIRPWAKEGRLPNFAMLITEGSHGILKSTLPPMSPPAWTSFQTGVNPGKHGVFQFCESRLDKPYQPVSSYSISLKPFWEFISEDGNKVGIVNIFGTFPPKPINGFIVSGRSVPRKRNFTYPSSLAQDIKKEIGDYIIDVDPYHATGKMECISRDGFIRLLHKMLDLRIETFLYLMEKFSPELFVIVFTVTDLVQHFFWQYIDKNHPSYNIVEAKRYGNTIFDIYKKIDEFLGKLGDRLGQDSTIIIVSDHGHGPWYKQLSLNRWLTMQGLLKVERVKFKDISVLKRIFKKLFPSSMYDFLKQIQRNISRKKSIYQQLPINWNRTKAFAFGHYGNIYINLKGREPRGIVKPGSEYENVCREIKERLLKWINPITGKPVVKRVYRKDELYYGDKVCYAPDLIIEWEDYAYLSSRTSDFEADLISDVPSFYKNVPQSGSHRKDGLLLIKGPNIKKGYYIKEADIIDIAPTILYLFRHKIPFYMDGKVLTEVFDNSYVINNPVEICETESKEPFRKTKKGTFSEEESQEIKERLKALGYLD
jgi:predicted AlkP superfamily phosphohydrolase/phosphomutase